MKKLLIGLLILILLISSFFLFNFISKKSSTNGLNNFYENELISIEYPKDWEYTELSKKTIYLGPDKAPIVGNIDETYLSITSKKSGRDHNLDTMKDSTEDQLKTIFNDLEFTEESEYDFKGLKAFRIVYTGKYKGEPLKVMHLIITDKKTREHSIGYSAKEKDYEKHLTEVNSIINSLVAK
jgi:hypothetical protein